jgi:hypothetical protein
VFDSIEAAKEAFLNMQGKRIDKCVWNIHAAKKYDEWRMKE